MGKLSVFSILFCIPSAYCGSSKISFPLITDFLQNHPQFAFFNAENCRISCIMFNVMIVPLIAGIFL